MEIQRCRFLEHIPAEIMHLAANNSNCLCLFHNSSIFLYKSSTWALIFTYPPVKSVELRRVLWHDSNSFVAAGLGGLLFMYSSEKIEPLVTCRVSGGGIWDMVNKSNSYLLACDDGILRLFTYEDESFTLTQSFPKQDSKLLSCLIHEFNYFASTSSGSIIKFSSKGQIIQRMQGEGPIWALAYVGNFLISGESSGMLSFWNDSRGTLKQQVKTHEADILCLFSTEEEVYASGVDSKVVRCSLHNNEWLITGKARGQSHDVRALAQVNGNLISGGVTSDICVYTQEIFETQGNFRVNFKNQVQFKKNPVRHIATLTYGQAVRTRKNVVMHNLGHSMHLWQIDNDSKSIVKLFDIIPKGNSGISAFALSKSLKHLSYSTLQSTKLLSLDIETPSLEYIENSLVPSTALEFSSAYLYLAYTDLYAVSLKTLESLHLYRFNSVCVKMSIESQYCCVLLRNNQVQVFKNNQFLFSLPQVEKPITAIGFGGKKNVYVVTDDNALQGYRTKTQEPDPFTSKYAYRLPKNFLNEVNRVVGILPFSKTALILYTHYSFTLVELDKKPPKKCEIVTKDRFPEHKHSWAGVLSMHSLHSKKKTLGETAEKTLENFVINKRFGPIYDMSVNDGVWTVCELDWDRILELKPKPLDIHKYGT
ncbi:hypothetical protein SteCoe_4217 [Stentor coeruleus]|uniref:Uncharacterized protein n=1 Tax=Stentor coeruleus TaxID=5963 RepID=A0A1R2CV78_9CILI|nr:hypothetical protein SteCoe_4217 [Stentor coeruleus]